MEKIRINDRLLTAVPFVREGKSLADIGTDHAYLPIYLFQSGKISCAVAADINRGPLDKARENIEKYGFEEIETPIFEFTEVFARNLGDTSDIVTKEMYCFNDRGGESLTLRPEGTAGVVRSFISEGMQQNLPVKLSGAGCVCLLA